jgi:hypothetical protein
MRQSGILPAADSEEAKRAQIDKPLDYAVSPVTVEDVIDPKIVSKTKFKRNLRVFKEGRVPEAGAKQRAPLTPGRAATVIREPLFEDIEARYQDYEDDVYDIYESAEPGTQVVLGQRGEAGAAGSNMPEIGEV